MTSKIVVNNIEADAGISTVTFGGNITVSTGSTNSPSITPTGDSNTGIFFPSADTIAFAEGGVEVLRITPDSKIGINSTSPTAETMDIVGEAPKININSTNGSSGFRLNIVQSSSQLFRVQNAGTTAFEVNSTGNVQIANGNLVFSTGGTGIDFSVTSDAGGMTSELLDDYEVGTWTPTVTASTSAPTISYTSGEREGRYVKIGKLVYVEFWIRISSCSAQGSGNLQISGIPYNEGSNAFVGQANFERFDFTGATAGSGEHILGEVNGAVIDMRRRANTGSVSAMATGSIPGGVSFAIGAATYTTS